MKPRRRIRHECCAVRRQGPVRPDEGAAVGVSFGLILGKQLGIFSAVYILVQSKAIKMPTKTTWPEIYGTAILCGIGFTMSLFVATLAFPPGITQEMAKVGIFIGSITAGLLGAIVLILAYQIRKMRGKI